MPTIGWDETSPADGSGANTGASAIRSLKSNLAGGLSGAIYWPGSGGASNASAGQPVPGAWRAFYGKQSTVSAYADGAMQVTSDTSRLFGVGSTGTMFLGSASALEHTTYPGTNVRWVMASGVTVSSTSFAFGPVYNGLPIVTFSVTTSGVTSVIGVLDSLTSSQARVIAYNATGLPLGSATTVYWQSVGTVTF